MGTVKLRPEVIRRIQAKAWQDLNFLKTHLGIVRAGYPHYFFPFGRDLLIVGWQMLPIDPSIAKTALAFCADTQGTIDYWPREEQPGRIFYEHRTLTTSREVPLQSCANDLGYAHHHPHHPVRDVEYPYYGGIDTTLLFIFLAGEYLKTTNDPSFIKDIWDHVVAAYEWTKQYGDKDGDSFIEYERQNPHGLFHQGWRDSELDHLKIQPPVAIVEAQGYAYAAYENLRYMAIELRDRYYLKSAREISNAFIMEVSERKTKLQINLTRQFYWQEEKYFYLALDGRKQPKRSVSSNQGHLLFTGILSEGLALEVINRLLEQDIFTPFGIRTVSENDLRFCETEYDPSSYHLGSIWPHDNWIIYEGCKRNGFTLAAEAIRLAMVSAVEKLGCIPELFGHDGKEPYLIRIGERECTYPANPIQGWSAAGMLNMLSGDVQI